MGLNILAIITSLIFVFISLLHFYWAAGGSWAMQGAMPEEYKTNYFNPKFKVVMTLATLVIAFGMLVFAFILLSNFYNFGILEFIPFKLLTGIIGGIFLARTIGDFRLFGLFKKKDSSFFSKKDSQVYVPLCFFLSASCLAIYFLT